MRKLDADLAEILGPEAEPAKPILKAVPKSNDQWDRCKQWIEAGLENSPLTIEDVRKAVEGGGAILWPGKNSAIVSEFIDYPSGLRTAAVMSAGGELEEIRAMTPGLEAFARLNGASEVLLEGRLGWKRALKDDGYELASVTLRKKL